MSALCKKTVPHSRLCVVVCGLMHLQHANHRIPQHMIRSVDDFQSPMMNAMRCDSSTKHRLILIVHVANHHVAIDQHMIAFVVHVPMIDIHVIDSKHIAELVVYLQQRVEIGFEHHHLLQIRVDIVIVVLYAHGFVRLLPQCLFAVVELLDLSRFVQQFVAFLLDFNRVL